MDLLNIEFATLTSFISSAVMLTLVVGYFRALRTREGAVFHLVLSIILIVIAYTSRTVYWDVHWLRNNVTTTDVDVNTLFDLLAVWGGIHGHIAIYKMIPYIEREHWRVFTAWLYPPFAMSKCFRHLIKRIMRWE